ncbi:chromosome partitioning protein ParB [Saccharobesus litoralis]|uniref:Probable chromosome-partitioning protein ParB n=1 Tax=Saccharobesus litoralis TaxID=2172099 RepID=A0A2S0VQD1_9ALTE|nr:ParB/RepB/Spo0J family partition protein [Saccharobesus litoralis]AWB66414.1 chromosome partitioning protein ParB [Saccharobesus litoralis]
MSAKKRGLGRGLDALLTNSGAFAQPQEEQQATEQSDDVRGELRKLPIEQLQPGKYQPRKDMSPEALEELSSSIRSQGIIQPIVVRQVADNTYEIIAGERRWRAAQLAELSVVPCLVKDVPDEAAVAIALIENIQREDLNAMEEAIALHRLMTEFELTHQQTADAVGKSRTTVTNLLRLNNLNTDVKTLLEHGDIEMGHARALLGLEGDLQSTTARTVVAKGLTVRDTEKLVNKVQQPEEAKPEKSVDPDLVALQNKLSESVGSKVTINYNAKGKGKLVIDFSNLDVLDGIIGKISN